ncbi:MAG: hypothetical protein NC548_06220 [Lachnospiraceae bacterium]|nr:hypothetical protein [Lachnospiraceae bacterium]
MPTERWIGGKYEVCKYVQVRPKGTSIGPLKLYCPRLMPLITEDIPKITPVGLSAKAVYRNADDCQITVPSQIPSQNFLTGMKPIKPFELPEYIYDTVIEVEPLDDDMLKARIVLNVDNSVP